MSNNKNKPPRFGEFFLKQLLLLEERYEKLGDFEEEYHQIISESGCIRARLWYWIQIFVAVPVFVSNLFYWSTIMFKNYLKITFRNLLKHKSYTVINISGLAMGIACCILIMSYIMRELSYDRFHERSNRIARIIIDAKVGGNKVKVPSCPAPVGPALLEEYPEIENTVRIRGTGKIMFNYMDKRFYETELFYVDNSVFNVFSFELEKGNPETALKASYSLVITREAAEKYFGQEDPVGKILKMNNEQDYVITGILKNAPENSHLKFDILLSFETLYKSDREFVDSWLGFNFDTYVMLKENNTFKEFNTKLPAFWDRHIGEILKQMGGELNSYLQPLTDIHLYSSDLGSSSDIGYVYAFSAIAAFILIIACINFMNLATARSSNRAKEVGMRKVLGAYKSQLVKQFLGESMMLTFFSLLIALVIVKISLPWFNDFAGTRISINYFESPLMIAGFLFIFIFTGLLAGSYPAFLLSGFMPVKALKGAIRQGAKSPVFRNVLVVFQFAISISLIIGTGIILNQINFMKNKKLGFNKEQVLVLNIQDDRVRNSFETVKSEILAINGTKSVSASYIVPGQHPNYNGYFPEGMPKDQIFLMEQFSVDTDFLETYDIELLEGRTFSKEFTSDTSGVALINEAAVKELNWDNPIGKYIDVPRNFSKGLDDRIRVKVIGVVKDFHIRSLYDVIRPVFITYEISSFNRLSIKLDTKNLSNTMSLIEQKWKKIDPMHPFESFFLDQSFDSKYKAEERLGSIFKLFSILAVIIGCLGLFGLASFTAEQRTKEIGIRKTLGASSSNITLLLAKEFVKWVLLANLIAWPVAYYFMERWLHDYAYATKIGYFTFVSAGILALLVALVTVSWQAVKAANANPVDSLKYE